MSFSTGYYDKGKIVTDKGLIAIKYIKGTLITDLLV